MTPAIKLSALDTHFADFIVRIDCKPCDELWWGAALASYSAGRGHTCLDLSELPAVSPNPFARCQRNLPPTEMNHWRDSLSRCDTVGAPGEYTPLVLDPAGRLYLHRCWEYEQQVAVGILARGDCPVTNERQYDELLDRYFPEQIGIVDLQRQAARMALTHRFSVISGGPGTGKTATVTSVLALLLELAGEATPNIMLAAPTGKAAMRLKQSIQSAAARLSLPEKLRDRLPAEVTTIHRLLGVQKRKGGFLHNRENRLSCDVLIVDEASMVDLQLMAALLEALRDDARVVLLGDRNQLASVEAGAVLADICDCSGAAAVPVTQLTKSYRFSDDSGIALLSHLINSGESSVAVELLKSGRLADIHWRTLPPGGRAFEELFKTAVKDGYAGYLRATSPGDALAALDSFRVLSPLRSGVYGIDNLNRLSLKALGHDRGIAGRGCAQMLLMITGNNYELGFFNGDTGVVAENEGREVVWFENPDGTLRQISRLRLPPSEIAFALTVHKSQGSEFDRVLLVLPEQTSEVLTRELFYTAVTRARRHIEIWGSEEVVKNMIDRRMVRNSGLRERLSEVA